MKSTIKSSVASVLALVVSMGMSAAALAGNVFSINDPQEIGYNSGYDIKTITFTLGADYSLTADIVPFGTPGDTDGDLDPNASSDPLIIDEPGVGSAEYLEIDMECGATDVSLGCNPNVVVIYTGNTLTVYNLVNGTDLTPYVTFTVLTDRYVMKINDLLAFKAALGISTTAVNFGAFHFVASFADNQVDDSIPDNFACSAVHLDPPVVAKCDLQLTKTANVSTVGPLAAPVGNEENDDDSSDSHQDTNGNGDSDDSESGDASLTCGCKGKVSELTLQYNGTVAATVNVDRIDPFSTNLFPPTTIQPGQIFTVYGSSFGPGGFKGTLGVGIAITKDGGDPVEIHTSCSEPVGPGLVAGDFVVLSGKSKKLTVPLCDIAPVGCPANQQVTYTYTLTNNGTDLTGVMLTDNKIVAPVAGPISLAANTTQVFTVDACLYETTTNIASATGTMSDTLSCASNDASVTVEMLVPPPPVPHCDAPVTPPPAPEYHGCGIEYWSDSKMHKSAWGLRTPDDRFDAVFGVDSAGNKGLLKVLKEKDLDGKGAASKDFQRHAAAAMLNATNPDVHYFYTPGEVVSIVVNAYATKSFDAAKQLLKTQNDLGCPLGD